MSGTETRALAALVAVLLFVGQPACLCDAESQKAAPLEDRPEQPEEPAAPKETKRPRRRESGSVLVDGVTRHYVVHLPRKYDRTRRTPLLIVLPEEGSKLNRFAGRRNVILGASRYGYVLAIPEMQPGGWGHHICAVPVVEDDPKKKKAKQSPPDRDAMAPAVQGMDVVFMTNLIEELVQRYAVDPSRVYMLGTDAGAAFAARVAQSVPSKIAAVALSMGEPMCRTGRWSLPAFEPAVPALLIQRVPPRNGDGGLGARGSERFEPLATWLELNECGPPEEAAGVEHIEYQCKRAPVVLAQAPTPRGLWPRRVASQSTMRTLHDFFASHRR